MKQALLIIAMLSCLIARADHSYILQNTLDGDQDHHYTANSHIILATGFKAEPKDGHEVLLDINTYGVFPPTNGITGGTAQNNAHGVVGSLGGHIDVSLLGGALYDIPIDLPLGLGKMAPQLSICYNSQAKNGLLGWAWDLGGISSITRVGTTPYHDGYISLADYNDDRYSLDGQRLMKVSAGNEGGHGVCYRTEQDRMSKIVSYHEPGINGTSYFKIWTADGKIMYYGKSEDSKALKDKLNHVNVWLLNKIEDRNGNRIEYHYTIEQKDYRLKEICYSGNSHDDIENAFKISFEYKNRVDIETSFKVNCIHQARKILDKIRIRQGNHILYTYQFNYKTPDPKNGFPYHLLTSIQFHAGDNHFNPTKIQWPSNNYNATSGSDLKIGVTTNGVPNAFINAVKFSGDLNGDGHTDVVSLQPNSNGVYHEAHVFINKGLDDGLTFDHVWSFTLSPYISWVQVTDFDGDGFDDILFANRIRRGSPLPDQMDLDIYLCKPRPSGTYEFNHQYMPLCLIPHSMEETHLMGDFFGDGTVSILIQSVSASNGLRQSLLYRYDNNANEFQLHAFLDRLEATRFFTADYNGDGITEILFKKADGATAIVQLEETQTSYHYQYLYTGRPYNWSDCFPGDFNGDGLTDALFYTSGSTSPWKIHLFNQTGISTETYTLPANFPYAAPGNYQFSLDRPNHTIQYIKTGDFDGNGCSDLALYKGNLFYVFYGPLREDGDNAPFAYVHKISAQAFNLYDNMNVCLGNFLGQERLSFLGNTTLSRLPSMRLRHEVKSFTDGLGRNTQLEYDYLSPRASQPTEHDFYRLTGPGLDHFHNVLYTAIPMRGLSKVTTYNVKGKPKETRCFYQDAMLQKKGKGFLGFSITRQEDYINHQLQQSAEKEFNIEYTDDLIHLALLSEEIFGPDGRIMARSYYSNRILAHVDNPKVYMLLSDKTSEAFDAAIPETLLKKEITQTEVATHCNQTNRYDDLISVTCQSTGTTSNANHNIVSACEFQEIVSKTYEPNLFALWLLNRPATITHTLRRQGNYDDIVQQETYTYYDEKPYQVKSVLKLPNDGSDPTDRLALLTEYQYDVTGNMTCKTISTPNDDEAPRQELFEYSKAFGRRLLTRTSDAMGQTSVYDYDTIYNHCTSVTDPNGLQTRYEQDPLGVTTTTHYPDGTQSCKVLRWSSGSYYQWEKKTGQGTKIQAYAITGEVLRSKSYDLNGTLTFTDIVYDDFGRIVKKSLPYQFGDEAVFLLYQYDPYNRVERITHPDGSYETIQHNGSMKTSTLFALNGDTQEEAKTFNVMGWTMKSTDAGGNSVIYDYRPDGKPLWAKVEGHEETRIEMEYDGLGNRIVLNDPNYGLSICEYNAFGALTKCVSPKQDETLYQYDVLGRTIERVESDHRSGARETTEWRYGMEKGCHGLLTDIIGAHHNIHYEYDVLTRLLGTTEAIEGVCYHTHYTYDTASRLASIRYPSDYELRYHYNSEGELRNISDSNDHLLWSVKETTASKQPTKILLGNGLITQYEYDRQTQRLSSILTRNEQETIQNNSYEYDEFSNMTSRIDHRHRLVEQFTYDDLNQLTNVDSNKGNSSFQYDALGRMRGKTNPSGAVFSNADYSGIRPHAIQSAEAPHQVFPQERMELEFTSFDKVSSIAEGDKTVSFEYGYDHQRIKMTENNHRTTRSKTYVNNCEFVEQAGNNSVWTFLSGPNGVFAVAETQNGVTSLHYILKDHLGSWITITDSEGNIEQENQFDAWGLCQQEDELMFDRGYTGHEHIRDMGLINMNGRLYDPLTSSMLSPDNYIQMPDLSQSFNRYAYCLNNPLTYTDPDGNFSLEAALMFYFLYFTDFGYEFQKYTQALAFHIDLHLSSQQLGIGADVSFGVPKKYALSYRSHWGITYYWNFYDNSYSGFEFRVGGEWYGMYCIGYSGTTFYQKTGEQTTNSIIIGNTLVNFTYENDYMFNIGKLIPFVPNADNGDRYRSAAARLRVGPFSLGVNIYTGDPGIDEADRLTFDDPEHDGRETYTISVNGDNPDAYRAGIIYVGIGPFKIGGNSERIRNFLQNRFAHDFLCQGDTPYFKALDRPGSTYFYFGTETGSTLW